MSAERAINVLELVRIGQIQEPGGQLHGKILTSIARDVPTFTHEHFGLLVCDLVRHIAAAYKVDEEDVWEWVEKERQHPTTDLQIAS